MLNKFLCRITSIKYMNKIGTVYRLYTPKYHLSVNNKTHPSFNSNSNQEAYGKDEKGIQSQTILNSLFSKLNMTFVKNLIHYFILILNNR